MKHLKKIFAAAIALVVAFAMVAPAFAQTVASGKGGNGSITIQNSSKGIHYTVKKVFDATYNTTTNSVAYTYDGTLPTNDYFAQDASTGAITVKSGATDAEGKLTQAAAKWLQDNITGEVVVNAQENTDGAAMVITGLQYGYYVVSSDLGTGTVLSVDSTAPSATMYDKNVNAPHFEEEQGKSVDDTTVNIGQTVTYTVSFTATNYTGSGENAKKVYAYKIEDTLPDFLSDVVVDSITVGTDDVTEQFDNKAITIDWVNADGSSKYANNTTVTITYHATVNANATIAGAGNTNTVTITPLDEGGNSLPGQISDDATVKTYALALKKVNDQGEALAGATFTFPFAVTESNGEYFVDASAATQSATLTTPADGVIVIKGVAAGTYSVEETEAPQGYNKVASPFDVTAVETSETTTSVTKYIDADGNVVDTQTDVAITYTNNDIAASAQFVVNKSGSTLPSTGGIGTTLFYVIGGILVAGAAIALVVKNRVAKEEQ